jgi:MoxR-like ATPase
MPATRTGAVAPAQVAVEPADFDRIITYITTEVLVERDLEMRVLLRAALAGVNAHMIGESGVAKSLALTEFAKSITDVRYFGKILHGTLGADAVIGPYDMANFAKTGDFERNVAHYAPNAHIVFLDELPRANGPLLDACLSFMNTQERMAEHNGGMKKTPIQFVVSGSNTWFDPENAQAQAISDRVTVMLKIEDIRSDDSFKELLRRDHARRLAGTNVNGELIDNGSMVRTGSAAPRETVTLDQYVAARDAVANVQLSPEFLDAAASLRSESKAEGLIVSPRRWVELVLVCRANAWMSGRDHTIAEDLAICEHGMWRDQDDIPLAHKLVLKYHGRFEREATAKRQEAAKAFASVEEVRPTIEGTPPNEDLDSEVLSKAIAASRMIEEVNKRVDAILAEADSEKRDAAALRELSNELLSVRKWFYDNDLPTKYKP